MTNPRGFISTLNFTAAGALSSATDGAGIVTSYSWDANTRLLSIGDESRSAYLVFLYEPWQSGRESCDGRSAVGWRIHLRLQQLKPGFVCGRSDRKCHDFGMERDRLPLRGGRRPGQSHLCIRSTDSGQVASIVNPLGQTITHVYNSQGQLSPHGSIRLVSG